VDGWAREGNALNTTSTRPPTLEVRGRTVVTIFMPFARASGGRSDAKIRAVFPPRTNGLKLIEAEVRWRVIIVGVVGGVFGRMVEGKFGAAWNGLDILQLDIQHQHHQCLEYLPSLLL